MKWSKLAFDGFTLIPPERRYEFSRSSHSDSIYVLPHLLVPAVAIASLTSLAGTKYQGRPVIPK